MLVVLFYLYKNAMYELITNIIFKNAEVKIFLTFHNGIMSEFFSSLHCY